ncbi:MAG TPA: hypothetical protein VMN78_07735 [Longimicrobiales bacterium]|nr:hypothetical protein [Longimicrobiales bacterium]
MVRGIAKAIAYTKMPRSTFALLHPVRAAKLGATLLVARAVFGRRR